MSFSYIFAGCEYTGINETKKEALDLYTEAKTLYATSKFSDAYDAINKSFDKYSKNSNSIRIDQNCVNVKAGPFGPIRNKYISTDSYKFDRNNLVRDIKKNVPPRPLVVIQTIKKSDKLIRSVSGNRSGLEGKITVKNVLNTIGNIDKNFQTPLNEFSVTANGNKVYFEKLDSKEEKTLKIKSKISLPIKSISTSEKFGFRTAQFR